MTDGENFPAFQMKILAVARKTVTKLELAMNYRAKGLSDQEQVDFDALFHNAIRMDKWVE